MSNCLWLHGLGPTRLLCPWDFPGKNTAVGLHFLLQGTFLTQGLNPHLFRLLHWQLDPLPLAPHGKPTYSCCEIVIFPILGTQISAKQTILPPDQTQLITGFLIPRGKPKQREVRLFWWMGVKAWRALSVQREAVQCRVKDLGFEISWVWIPALPTLKGNWED